MNSTTKGGGRNTYSNENMNTDDQTGRDGVGRGNLATTNSFSVTV